MTPSTGQLDVLIVSRLPLWPADQGYRVHGSQMARALAALGVRVGLASLVSSDREAPLDLRGLCLPWPAASADDIADLRRRWSGPLGALRRKLAAYLAAEPERLAGIIELVKVHRPRVVLGLCAHSPALLAALGRRDDTLRVWYGADELVAFHASCLLREPWSCRPRRLRRLVQDAALEQLLVRGLDGAIGVSPADTRLLRLIAGARQAITIRNGVDLDYFHPPDPPPTPDPYSLVFWGRLDFAPNIDAVRWFAHRVWPQLHWRRPEAHWRIIGKNPDPRVLALADMPGIDVLGEVPDIRPHAAQAALTILPMRCGRGIKNKLLEAAGLARPIVASPRAVEGLEMDAMSRPVALCRDADQWAQTIRRLWSDRPQADALGRSARAWVERHHDWTAAADNLCRWLASLPGSRFVPPAPTAKLPRRQAA